MIGPIAKKILGVLAVVYVVAGCAAVTASDSPVPTATSTARTSAEARAGAARSQETLTQTVSPSTQPSADPATDELATRIVVKALGINLPIVSGDLHVPSNPPDYPLCDVAQYLTTYRFPGRLGTTTWIYGHARSGMLLPLLEASQANDGSRLVGLRADLYTDGARRYTYRITKVLRHATDRSSATQVARTDHRLVLQTSEGTERHDPQTSGRG